MSCLSFKYSMYTCVFQCLSFYCFFMLFQELSLFLVMCMFFLLSSVFFWFLLVLVSTLSFFILCPNPAPQWKVMLAPSEGSDGANLYYHVAMLSHQLIPNLEHPCNRCCWSNAFSIAIITQMQSTGIITGHNHYHDI